MPHLWVGVGLPGLEQVSTYQGYPLETMPDIPIKVDEDLSWLLEHGEPHPTQGLDQADHFARPLPAGLALEMAANRDIALPLSFRRFMTSAELQSRVRSCTDCYLDPGERIIETTGSMAGYLIHFLSDSQFCAHWYLHVLRSGDSAVLESDDAFCYSIEHSAWSDNPACLREQVDIEQLDFRFCSPSFSEFLFRFWIENEIWFAFEWEETKRPLKDLERHYLAKVTRATTE